MSHDEAADEAERMFREGLAMLQAAADILRGPDVEASPQAMRTEMALSRAIETLDSTGFRVPRSGR